MISDFKRVVSFLDKPCDAKEITEFSLATNDAPLIETSKALHTLTFVSSGVIVYCIPIKHRVYAISLHSGGDVGFSDVYSGIARFNGELLNSITFSDDRNAVFEKMGKARIDSNTDFAPTKSRHPDRSIKVCYDVYRYSGLELVFGFNLIERGLLFRIDISSLS